MRVRAIELHRRSAEIVFSLLLLSCALVIPLAAHAMQTSLQAPNPPLPLHISTPSSSSCRLLGCSLLLECDDGGLDIGSGSDSMGQAQGLVLNITISSLGRTSSASVTAAQPCSYGTFIITASQLLPLLPPPQLPSSCILPPLYPLPLLFQVSLHRPQLSSLPQPAPLPPVALGQTSLNLTVSPFFLCLFNKPSPPADLIAMRLSLPPPLLNLIARHAATMHQGKSMRMVVLLMAFDAHHAAAAAHDDMTYGAFDTAGAGSVTFVLEAATASDVDAVVVNCSYPHMHLMTQWQRVQAHVTFATIGFCTPPAASILHFTLPAPFPPLLHRSIAASLLSPRTPLPFSPFSPKSSARIAALAYAACNVSASVAHDSSSGGVALERSIACLENELMLSTTGLQLQYDCVVVNLDRRRDRWINMLLRLIAVGLPCSRLSAADGSKHSAAALLQMHALPPSLFDGNNFNTSPPIAACAVSHILAWRRQKQGRGLLVMEDDGNMVLNVVERMEQLRESAREIGAKLLMMAPGETFEEDTLTCTSDDDDCSSDGDDGVRLLREKMTLYGQAYFLDDGAGQLLLQLLRGGVTCAIDWWLGLMWHGGNIDAAVARRAVIAQDLQDKLASDLNGMRWGNAAAVVKHEL